MGKFSKDVRRNVISGPNQKGFNRAVWTSAQDKFELDAQDIRLIEAGLLFDNLLHDLREDKQLLAINLKPTAIIRLLIAITTNNLLSISNQTRADNKENLVVSDLISETIELSTGQKFSPDELLTGMGDGLKHIFRELLLTKTPHKNDEYLANEEDMKLVIQEFNKAIIYQCVVEQWLDCVGNGFSIEKKEEVILISPFDEVMEISRIASIYRRLNIEIQNSVAFNEYWQYKLKKHHKTTLCKIPLVSKVYGTDEIVKIEVGLDNKVLESSSNAIAAKLYLAHGYYGNLLDMPMQNFNDFTLNQIIDGWRVIQSLAAVIFKNLKVEVGSGIKDNLALCPKIKKNILIATFSRIFKLEPRRSEELINVFVFTGDSSQDIWAQPLIRLDDCFCIVISAVISVHLLRITETWMRQGGLNLDIRGKEFEQYCIKEIKEDVTSSKIKQSIFILDKSFIFHPPKQREEEIDILIAIKDTVLLIEAKCILWPDDSLQFANYRDTVEKATIQISRKKQAVLNNLDSFKNDLQLLGYEYEPKNIICCVLTNSAVYSGFPINDVPIIDLSILNSFFSNTHVKSEARSAGGATERHSINFYDNADEAAAILEPFLLAPPQLDNIKNYIKSREIIFPVTHDIHGQLILRTFGVEINSEELMQIHNDNATAV